MYISHPIPQSPPAPQILWDPAPYPGYHKNLTHHFPIVPIHHHTRGIDGIAAAAGAIIASMGHGNHDSGSSSCNWFCGNNKGVDIFAAVVIAIIGIIGLMAIIGAAISASKKAKEARELRNQQNLTGATRGTLTRTARARTAARKSTTTRSSSRRWYRPKSKLQPRPLQTAMHVRPSQNSWTARTARASIFSVVAGPGGPISNSNEEFLANLERNMQSHPDFTSPNPAPTIAPAVTTPSDLPPSYDPESIPTTRLPVAAHFASQRARERSQERSVEDEDPVPVYERVGVVYHRGESVMLESAEGDVGFRGEGVGEAIRYTLDP